MSTNGISNIVEGREGEAMYELVKQLYPICRSITGNGVRESLALLQERVPMTIREVPTGTQVFDWTVPKEWNVKDAFIKDASGKRVVDFRESNLHVVNYSIPVRARMGREELAKNVFTLPDQADWIPYRTSYYKETWGFCLSQRQWDALPDGEYEVCIESTLEPGHLTYGEYRIQGETDEEVLISCHSCHPSLCNDNLSGMVVAAGLAQRLLQARLRYTFRFLWIPGTIGAITWLALNEKTISKVKHGLVVSCVGDAGKFTYKRSRQGDAEIDRVLSFVLRAEGREADLQDFTPYGYDERQYCSPGINLPVGCFMRTPNGKYPEYHTSADNLKLVSAEAMAESLEALLKVVSILEKNRRFLNLNPKCEPQLGRRGLYRQTGGTSSAAAEEAMLWVLNLSDGAHTLLDIAERAKLDFGEVVIAAEKLLQHDLLRALE